jgi:protein-S-isoprenylcysteine O-methyltransferase Ste14
MQDDVSFRLALLTIVLVVLPLGLRHRVRSQATGEPLDRRQEGIFILATLRPIGLVLWLSVLAFMIDPGWMAWSALPLPAGLRWGGIVLCATGGGLLLWTMERLGRNLTDTVVTRREHSLVVDGPYRFVRHPLYGAAALFAAGVSLAAGNWFIAVLGVMMMGLLVIRTRIEEANLLKRFGPDYATYVAATGRFFPAFRRPS